jgi:hypothetical protein
MPSPQNCFNISAGYSFIDNGANCTEKLLQKTQVSEDFA